MANSSKPTDPMKAARITVPPAPSSYSQTLTKHTIVPTVYEREDGMAILRIKDAPGAWMVRVINGPSFFWNGQKWVICTLIPKIVPNEFRFNKEQALALLEDLDHP